MLNEYLEFEAYVTTPESDTPRIQPYLLTESFLDKGRLNGIEQILTVIARAFIFSDDKRVYDDSGLIDEQLINATIELLHRWSGFDDTDQRKRTKEPSLDKWFKEYPDADGWLKKYWIYHFDKGKKKKETRLGKEELWEKVQEKWNDSLNHPYDYRAKQISYKNVIANALEMGPLRKRYFVIKKDDKHVKAKAKDNKRFDYLYEVQKGTSKPQEKTKMKFLKIIVAYLIWQEYHPEGQREVLLRRAQLLGWYGLDDAKNDSRIWYRNNLLWNGKPIFSRNLPGHNYIKLSIERDYLNNYGFCLIDEKEIDEFKGTHWILKDCGHGLNDCWTIK